MAVRTVRLDAESERALAEVRKRTGMSVSTALKRGLIVLREHVVTGDSPTFGEVFRTLDIGPGGYLRGDARRSKELVRAALIRKHGR